MNLYISVVRTLVPLFVGWVVTAAGAFGVDTDSESVTAGVTALVSAGYYAVFRALEEWATKHESKPLRLVAGVLLGWARPPQYPPRAAAEPSDAAQGQAQAEAQAQAPVSAVPPPDAAEGRPA
ncbi:hypothetical protein O7599_29370 [Streptomyces sp. WMMC500]|uniref:hypothetical protein n=1 Tax=Streptomyces sp. WMMC500 TaxID=3015154 RepID=UPI00248B40A5|nr:hypothetical protein [Streptomyces sp. WMMC500]WBB59632.1 hypothetical protein O7599_29370 [Streptomyces sp. WMMC500]